MASGSSGHTEGNEPAGVGLRRANEDAMAESGESGVRNTPGSMHPAPSLEEAPPFNFRMRQHDLQALTPDVQRPGPGSGSSVFEDARPGHYSLHDPAGSGPRLPPPFLKSTNDSTATTTTRTTSSSLPSAEEVTTSSSIDTSSTTLDSQPGLLAQDGLDEPDERHTPKPTRRRTGPLNQEQRVKAAIIRKMGACQDCKRRRVSCDPTRMLPSH